MRRTPLLALCFSLACASSGDSLENEPTKPIEPTPELQPQVAAQTMTELERRLQAAARVEIAFVIESEGALVSRLEGKLAWSRDGALSLTATGTFADAPQQLELRGDAHTLGIVLAGESRWSGARPPALIEALVIGLTRQGLLHNLAMLSGGLPPDHADGGVAEWVEWIDPQLGAPEVLGAGQARPLDFEITVEDQRVAHATLWLDDRGLPLERRQIVDFPEGQMRVTERYTSFDVVD